MRLMRSFFGLMAVSALALVSADARATFIRTSTFDPGGADAELRESAPANRGGSDEIASRIDPNGRNSVIYLKFGVANISARELSENITVRTTLRNTNLNNGRISIPNILGGATAGFDYFVLDPTVAGADWDESRIAPRTTADTDAAPGYMFDGDFSTKPTGTPGTPTAGLNYLGSNSFDPTQLSNYDPVTDSFGGHLLVGSNYDLVSLPPDSPLHNAIIAAQATDHKTVTVVMGVSHPADSPNGGWIGFNYLFNPKEKLTLNDDPDSPFSGADNSMGQFAPALITVIPEPTSFVLLGIGGLALAVCRRRS